MEPSPSETSPMNAVGAELDLLQADFGAAIKAYSDRIESEIGIIRAAVEKESARNKVSGAKIRDLRDMLTLLRKFQIKPEKGRRKDLKKLDDLVGDLTLLIENW